MRVALAVLGLVLCSCNFDNDAAFYCSEGHRGCPRVCPANGTCTLADHQANVYDAALYDGALWWTNNNANGSVWKTAIEGIDEPTEIVTGRFYPSGIAVNADSVYFLEDAATKGTVVRYERSNGTLTTLVEDIYAPCRVHVNETELFFSSSPPDGGASLNAMPLGSSGTPQRLRGGLNQVCRFTLSGSNLFFTEPVRDGGVVSMNTDGTNLRRIADSLEAPSSVVTDSQSLYWVTYSDGNVVKASFDGSGQSTLASGQLRAATVVTDGQNVYWATFQDGEGKVLKTSVNGGDAVPVATNLKQPLLHAVDDSFVYWSTLSVDGGGGGVYRAPK